MQLNLADFEVLTFDCYGTLIDWETGIWDALHSVFASHRIQIEVDQALELYGELEAEVEQEPYREYKKVLSTVLNRLGLRLGFVPTSAELESFSRSVKNWPAFPDSSRALQKLEQKYKLAIISNIDDDLFAFSAERLQTNFEWIITAQQVKSYKPSLNNFQFAFERIAVPQNKILHVAQSLYHDMVPAKALGLSTVWINRRRDKLGFGATPPAQVDVDLEVPNMQVLADML